MNNGQDRNMIGVDEALERILARFTLLDPIDTPIIDALGLVTTSEVVSTVDVPPFRNSAMDGYAVRSADIRTAPVTLRVVGTVAAGSVPDRDPGPGEAVRIMTGAPLPDGADAVVRFEDTDEPSRSATESRAAITIAVPVQVGTNVREVGEDIRVGQSVLPAGVTLGPAEIGVLAALNVSEIAVHRRPSVAILSTGDELADPGTELRPGQIRNSNSSMLAALVRQAGGEPTLLGVARDTGEDVRAKLRHGPTPDLFITSGGVSVGDYDVVKDVLQSEGKIDIWQVRMKPGKPLAFGMLHDTPLLGLPGNPVAAFVTFQQFARPAIRRMLGHRALGLPEVDAVAIERIPGSDRRHYVRGIVEWTPGGLVVRPTAQQGSAVLTAVLQANCLIVVLETHAAVEPGETVRVQLLNDTVLV